MASAFNTTSLPAQQPGLRPFIVYDRLPPNCVALLVSDERTDPLLRPGDAVVVDTTDCDPAEHELFAIDYGKNTDRPQRCIVEMHTQLHRNSDGEFTGWWSSPYNRPRSNAEAAQWQDAGRPMWFSDGPVDAASKAGMDYLRDKIVGRIIGILLPVFEEPQRLIAA